MRAPPREIALVLLQAAIRSQVPLTVLAALAYQESKYKPDARGKAGEVGLMQLMPLNVKRYDVKDPTDPAQSAFAAAQMIALYARATDYEWHTVYACYKAGPTAGQNEWSAATIAYSKQVARNRIWLQNRNLPDRSQSPVLQLGAAIEGLAHLNPKNAQAQDILAQWQKYSANGVPKGPIDRWTLGAVLLKQYATCFDRAVITDSKTPP